MTITLKEARCPLKLSRQMWPGVKFYDRQVDVVRSVRDSRETYVTAGNKLGKDYVAGYVALSFFLCPQVYFDDDYVAQVYRHRGTDDPLAQTRRVVTTSVNEKHLNVLWGEIGRYVATCSSPLLVADGGPLIINHMEIRFASEMGVKIPVNYLKGLVSNDIEGMSGHHADYTLFVMDEASGIDDVYYEAGQGWAKRMLAIGNPNACSNFFKRGVKAGVLEATVR